MFGVEAVMIAYFLKDIGSMAVAYFSSSNNNNRANHHYERPNYDIQFALMNEKLGNIGDQQSKQTFVLEILLGVILFALLVAFVLVCIIILIMVFYCGWKILRWLSGKRRNALQSETRNMMENIPGFRGPRLQTNDEQQTNRMIEEDDSETLYKQQMGEAIRQSLEEQVQKLEEEVQQKRSRKSSRHNFGGNRPRDIHPRRKPSKVSKNEFEYETCFHTDDTDGGLRRMKRSNSYKRHNDLKIDDMKAFYGFQEERLPFYRSARGVDDIQREVYQSDNSSESDDERNARQMWDDEEIRDLRELEELQLVTAISRSIEEQ